MGSSRSWSKLPAKTMLAGQPDPASRARPSAASADLKLLRAKPISALVLANSSSRQSGRHGLIGLDAAEPESEVRQDGRGGVARIHQMRGILMQGRQPALGAPGDSRQIVGDHDVGPRVGIGRIDEIAEAIAQGCGHHEQRQQGRRGPEPQPVLPCVHGIRCDAPVDGEPQRHAEGGEQQGGDPDRAEDVLQRD
ncbi:hypothetical protein [Bradyrhizobium liaoningense]